MVVKLDSTLLFALTLLTAFVLPVLISNSAFVHFFYKRQQPKHLKPSKSTQKNKISVGLVALKSVLLEQFSGDAFILSKCNGCGHGQDWANGNSYYTMYNDKTYYCSTASSLWETAERMTDHKHSF